MTHVTCGFVICQIVANVKPVRLAIMGEKIVKDGTFHTEEVILKLFVGWSALSVEVALPLCWTPFKTAAFAGQIGAKGCAGLDVLV